MLTMTPSLLLCFSIQVTSATESVKINEEEYKGYAKLEELRKRMNVQKALSNIVTGTKLQEDLKKEETKKSEWIMEKTKELAKKRKELAAQMKKQLKAQKAKHKAKQMATRKLTRLNKEKERREQEAMKQELINQNILLDGAKKISELEEARLNEMNTLRAEISDWEERMEQVKQAFMQSMINKHGAEKLVAPKELPEGDACKDAIIQYNDKDYYKDEDNWKTAKATFKHKGQLTFSVCTPNENYGRGEYLSDWMPFTERTKCLPVDHAHLRKWEPCA